MVEWCPKCHAQLPPGLEKCPRCGKKLRAKNGSDWTLGDVFWLSATTLGFVLVPLIVVVVVALVCIYAAH